MFLVHNRRNKYECFQGPRMIHFSSSLTSTTYLIFIFEKITRTLKQRNVINSFELFKKYAAKGVSATFLFFFAFLASKNSAMFIFCQLSFLTPDHSIRYQ